MITTSPLDCITGFFHQLEVDCIFFHQMVSALTVFDVKNKVEFNELSVCNRALLLTKFFLSNNLLLGRTCQNQEGEYEQVECTSEFHFFENEMRLRAKNNSRGEFDTEETYDWEYFIYSEGA